MWARAVRTRHAAVLLALCGFAGFAVEARVKLKTAVGTAVLVASGQDGDKCLRHKLVTGTGTLVIGNALESASGCRSELVVFSKGRESDRLVAPAWTSDPAQPLEVTLSQRLDVPVNLVVRSGQQSVAGWAKADVALANAIFNDNRVGMRFVTGPVYRNSAAQAEILTKDCEGVADLRAAGPPLYRPDRINVYYVSLDYYDTWSGYNCFQSGAPNVIFISRSGSVPTTLAHELGHALNLRNASGHTDPSEGNAGMESFGEDNLMYSWADDQGERDHLSVGQVFRMNWDGESWLNEGNVAQPVRPVIDCQDSATVAGACPKLSLDLESK